MKKFKIVSLILMIILFMGCSKEKEVLKDRETLENISYQETNLKSNNVVIELEDERKILIELYPDIAPLSVKNFQKLVKEEFYNGVIFHRVIKGFMIQTGD